MTQREQFEAWYSSKETQLQLWGLHNPAVLAAAWAAWQAAQSTNDNQEA